MNRPSTPADRHRDPGVNELAEHLFRHESGKLISILTGIYGARRLQLAEDVVQDALIRAMKSWPFGGVPENPTAWLLRTAKNLAIDQLRREKNFLGKQAAIVSGMEIERSRPPSGAAENDSGVADSQLRLMFVCCHPSLPPEVQSALALKTLYGFSPAEIAQAFLITEAAVAKRLTRARQRIREQRLPFEIPCAHELPGRLDGVLKILYLLFNEGHKASRGEAVVRADLCGEALRLALLLAAHPAVNQFRCHALIALMALTSARLPARIDSDGDLLRLEDQDRSRWDRQLIQLGVYHLGRSAGGANLSEYHLQAGIGACHSLADSDATTDWSRIFDYYDRLVELHPSPIIGRMKRLGTGKLSYLRPDRLLSKSRAISC